MRRSAAPRAELLAAFDQSGVSAAEFAAQVGVKYATFASWWQARPRGTPRAARPPVRFLEAAVPPPVALELPGGVRLRLSEPVQVPLVAALLRGSRHAELRGTLTLHRGRAFPLEYRSLRPTTAAPPRSVACRS